MFEKINSISKIISSMKLNKFVKDLECRIGKKLLHDTLLMEGFVDIINGDNVVHSKNSIVDQGLIGLINWLGVDSVSASGVGSHAMSMYIGSDTTTSTTPGMTTLATPKGASPGTVPSTTSGTLGGSSGQWQVQWIATWNPNIPTITGTLGEVALYLQIAPTLQAYKQVLISNGPYLFSRMASKDGKFTSFTINPSVPLSIAWTFQLTFMI